MNYYCYNYFITPTITRVYYKWLSSNKVLKQYYVRSWIEADDYPKGKNGLRVDIVFYCIVFVYKKKTPFSVLSTNIKLKVVIKLGKMHAFPRHTLSRMNMGVKSHIQTNSNNNISFYFGFERNVFFFDYNAL